MYIVQPFHNGHIFNEPFQAANNNNVVKHSLITYSFFPQKIGDKLATFALFDIKGCK